MSRSNSLVRFDYDRKQAVEYAHRWAFGRNPRYYNFTGLGGDCVNFASQCLFAGIGIMNRKPLVGWYYGSPDERTPSWSGIQSLYDFLIGNTGAGPYAAETGLDAVEPGDIVQLAAGRPDFHHTVVVVGTGGRPDPENTLIAAHSYDSDNRPLASYGAERIRCLHILGGRRVQ